MDFTYALALLVAAVVGVLLQVILLILKRTERYGLGTAFGVALGLNVAFLINWRSIGDTSAVVLVADLILLPACSLIGAVLGTLPLLVVVGVGQKLLRLRQRAGD